MTAETGYDETAVPHIAMLSIHSSPLGPLGTRDTGGMSVYIRELCQWLGAHGHTVDIFTCAGTSPGEVSIAPNVRLVRLPVRFEMPIATARLQSAVENVFEALEVYRQQRGRTYDLIHSHYWLSGVVGAMAQTRWHRPHITMFHTLAAMKNRSCSAENESADRIAHERWLAATADHMVVPTQREMDNLLGVYQARQEKISVIPCGVNLDLFRPKDRQRSRKALNVPADADLVLYVGRFAPLKGVERLLAAASLLRPRWPRLQLMIVGGDGPESPAYRDLVAHMDRLGINDMVRFPGRVAQRDLSIYYSAADLLALPSHYESFGLVVLEALACGTPVAATPVGVVENLLRPGVNGDIVRGSQPADLAATISGILGQPRRQARTIRRIRHTVNDFDWPRVAAEVAAVYTPFLTTPTASRTQQETAPWGGLSN